MEVIVVESAEDLGRIVASAILRVLETAQQPLFGLATGSSPLPVYEELVRLHVEQGVSLRHANMCLLDEYLGLKEGHPELYRAFIRRVFVGYRH